MATQYHIIDEPFNIHYNGHTLKKNQQTRINNQIRAREVRVIDTTEEGKEPQVMDSRDAIALAQEKGLDLIEISPNAKPPVAKIMDYGKFKYDEKKKAKEQKKKTHQTETKAIQVKIGTGDDMLTLKAKKASEWLKEGHRIKVELYLVGRSKYTDKDFKQERLDRILNLITENYKIAQPLKKSPKGMMVIIEKDKSKNKDETENSSKENKDSK
jgi:translation initiation factor IF-3